MKLDSYTPYLKLLCWKVMHLDAFGKDGIPVEMAPEARSFSNLRRERGPSFSGRSGAAAPALFRGAPGASCQLLRAATCTCPDR